MSVSRTVRALRLAALSNLFLVYCCVAASHGAPATLTRLEATCASRLGSGGSKILKTQLKFAMKCRNARAAGSSETCPDALTTQKVAKSLAALSEDAAESCGSRCSISSTLPCLNDLQCPPLGTAAERCTAGAKGRPFDMANMGFPGPFCEMALGGAIDEAADLGACGGILVEQTGERLLDALYGGPSGPSALSEEGRKCLSAVAAGARQIVVTTFKSAAKCRATVARGKLVANPFACLDSAPKLRVKVDLAKSKARSLIIGACPPPVLAELPACGTADGMTTSAAAANCVVTLATEATDPRIVPAERGFGAPSFLEAVFPPAPVCGDGVVNQKPSAFLPLGEECDGGDDTACPGDCIDPGDLFECTCANVPRMRLFTNAELSENDSGWTGLGHDQPLGHLSGFVSSLSNCDCGHMENGECVGTSTDPLCDVGGKLAPRCSWSADGSASCANNADCAICDAASLNAGAACTDEGDCQAQCRDSAGVATGACTKQTDCAQGEVCRGRCDITQTCIFIPNGAPHPVSAASVAVCAVQTFRSDLTGTRNLLTGAHELFYKQRSKIHLAERQDRPCPVCGGFCKGGDNDLAVCHGRCSGSGAPCRYDTECGTGNTCSETSSDCPGGKCVLALVCGASDDINPGVSGRPCRVAYADPVFGTPSNDCPPAEGRNISGQGLKLDYLPATSGSVMLPASMPCTAPGFELYDCPCPDDGGQPTAPNACVPACNAPGPGFGVGCADGGASGTGTVCNTGANAGRSCDEDGDCPGALCSTNPLHCVGDAAFERRPCSTNADCGLGLCVDACPGGRCVPLCVAVPGDPVEGACAAGPVDHHCSGEEWSYRTCTQSAASAGCAATCSAGGTACTSDGDCALGDTCSGSCQHARDCEAGPDGLLGNADDVAGAGLCVNSLRECFLHPIVASGSATTLSDHDSAAVWCFGKAQNDGVNAASGFGGPGRVEIRGHNVVNFTSIPP